MTTIKTLALEHLIRDDSPCVRVTATDRLIDHIVYRLYGLTEQEIRLVEGKAAKE